MRSEVSGVRNSCATVATRSFLSSSKRRRRVTSWSTTVAPDDGAVLAVDRRGARQEVALAVALDGRRTASSKPRGT